MSKKNLSLEQAIQIARKKILPAGFKPEDYFVIGNDFPLRIAILIVKEANYILKYNE